MTDLGLIDTIVIVLLENRSFDHVLGHLSYGEFRNGTEVDGLHDPLQRTEYKNLYGGQAYYPATTRDGMLATDLPHERELVRTQLASSPADGHYRMNGFVEAYYQFTTTHRTLLPEPMGFLTPSDVPITNFLANQFAVCDRWFAPLPASTQPNKIMAYTGATRIDRSSGVFPKVDPTLLDWLTDHHVPWRVYSSGLSFFALLGRFDLVLGEGFRPFARLPLDVATEPDASFPKVVVVEPSFGDAPVHLGYPPNDNHPPLAIAFGEEFLRTVYSALSAGDRWARTLLVITYDEHGGFFDHVPPLPIPYEPPAGEFPPFESTGLRVPALVVSPLVASRTVVSHPMDHTSILQLLAEKFGDAGESYSPAVRDRRDNHGIVSVSQALNLDSPRVGVPRAPTVPLQGKATLGMHAGLPSPMQQAFANAATHLVSQYPTETKDRYPELFHWAIQSGASLIAPQPGSVSMITPPRPPPKPGGAAQPVGPKRRRKKHR